MPDINHVLDAIDHALEDWSVSPDAMRWEPGQPRTKGRRVPVASTSGEWQPLGWTDETHVFEPADLQPYLETIRRDIRQMAMTYRMPPPPDVHEMYDEDWNDRSGTRIVRYQRSDGAWIIDTISRTSDGVEHIEGRRIETIRDVTP